VEEAGSGPDAPGLTLRPSADACSKARHSGAIPRHALAGPRLCC
jgi:hypothetical protein